ncbi:MAG: protein kinase [Chitinivibrionales bacterium]|nr:protein kinase [Chitinivibrionales bacterium]
MNITFGGKGQGSFSMINTAIRKSQRQFDNIVAGLGRRFTMHESAVEMVRSPDRGRLLRVSDRIRRTFARHNPPIYVGRHVGTGGFADVFLAESSYEDETRFAVKVLRSDLLRLSPAEDRREEEMRIKEVKRRFSNEAYIQWHLSKSLSERVARGVVKVYDHGEFDTEEEFRFILMERMGLTLRVFLSDPANFGADPDLLLYKTVLMTKIADIVSNVHKEGVFHRDIKPENILFPIIPVGEETAATDTPAKRCARQIQVKLADFGTVRWVRSHNDSFDGAIIGSQFYMSPEQIFHPRRLDPRTDIYSFGLVCYELLHGVHAKEIDKRTAEPIDVVARKQPVRLRAPEGFEPLNDIIMTCLAELEDRYRTMDEVVGALRAFMAERWSEIGKV